MDDMGFLRDLVVLFSLAVLVVVACHRIRIPPLVGFLITGVIAGPSVLGVIHEQESIDALAELGVVLLLFSIGIEFSLERLIRIRSALLVGGGLQVLFTTVAAGLLAAAASFLGPELLSFGQAAFLGMLIALSSTAIVLKLLADKAEIDGPPGRISLGILIFQDLCIVPMMIVVPFLAGKGTSAGGALWLVAKAALVVAGAVVGGRYVVPWMLQQIVRTRSRETFLLVVLILCLGAAWLSWLAGLSLALGAFIAGIIVSQSEYSHQALGEIIPFRDAFSSVFLISIGMLLDLRSLQEAGGIPFLLAVVAAIIILKALVVWGVTLILGYSFRVAVITGLTLAQVGEFSFVLALRGREDDLLEGGLYQLFLASAVITMMLTPLLKAIAPWAADRLAPLVAGSRMAAGRIASEAAAIGELDGHVIIIGFGLNGRNLAHALKLVSVPYVVIEMNPETVAAERRKGEPIIYGDASSRAVLEHAGIQRARVLVIAVSDPSSIRRSTDLARRLSPSIHIIVRTRYLQEMKPLLALGANEVVPEEFETSIEIFSRTLRKLLVPRDVVERFVRAARQNGYGALVAGGSDGELAADARELVAGAEIEVFRVEPGSMLEGRSLGEASIRSLSGATVLALRYDGQFVTNPPVSTRLEAGTVAIVFGTPEQVAKAAVLFRPAAEAGKDAP